MTLTTGMPLLGHNRNATRDGYESNLREVTTVKTSEMITSKFLRKEDVADDTRVTISGIKLEDLGREDAKESRYVLYFKQFEKGLVMNVTTIRVLESAFGDETDNWLGKQCLLYVDPSVSFQGRVVGGLRIRVPRPAKAATAAPGRPQKAPEPIGSFDDDMDADNIPF